MLSRNPVVAGTFYPDAPALLRKVIAGFEAEQTASAKSVPDGAKAWGAMLPHAGYIYCGEVIAATLQNLELPPNLVILCPNHTGRGQALGVWPEGEWLTPLGSVRVNTALAEELCNASSGFSPDIASHLQEHSIEVILPFLQVHGVQSIVPICVGTRSRDLLRRAGESLGSILRGRPGTGLIVSSDMNHYEDVATTVDKDEEALKKVLANDPDGLLEVVARSHISMCGAAPAALAMYAAGQIGKLEPVLAAHDTSASASRDTRRVVGYAGVQFFLCEQD